MVKNIKLRITCLILLVFIVTIGFASASDTNSSEDLTVEESEDLISSDIDVDGDSFSDIQDAVDDCESGDTIYLNGKTYTGNGTQITISKSLTIDGSGKNTDSKSTIHTNVSSRVFSVSGNCKVVLKNIIFEKLDFNGNGAAIYQNTGSLSLINCNFRDFSCQAPTVEGGAIYMGDYISDFLYQGIDNQTRFEIAPQVDLSISKSSDRDSYFVGEIATYTITLKSLGTEAHDVEVRKILPEVFEIIESNASNGVFADNEWSIPLVGENSTETLMVKVLLTSNGTFTNTVNVTSREEDINETNNIANRTITVKTYADLNITKTNDVKLVKVGDNIVWTITVKNNGLMRATDIIVTDKLPDGVKYLSDFKTKGIYDYNSGVWSIAVLMVGETVILNITTEALKIGNATNVVNVTSNEEDINETNNVANSTVSIRSSVDLGITKTSDVKSVKVGDNIVWTITVKNNGLMNATGVIATDKLPDGVRYLSHSATKGVYDSQSGVWNISDLSVNETVILNITTEALKISYMTNMVNVTSNEEDINGTDNEDNATVEIFGVLQDNPDDISDDDIQMDDVVLVEGYETPIEDDKKSSHPKSDSRATGNPIFLILLALISLFFAVRRKF